MSAEGTDNKMELDPEIERQLREAAEAEENKMIKELKDKCDHEFNKRQSLMTEQFDAQFSSQMSKVGDRYTSHTQDKITGRQTDILRANKVIRDVSRDLGDDWKRVFSHLMKEVPADQVKVELARIERQKPFMQPFKALNTWKDSMGDKFEIRLLVDALMSIERRDLAEKAMDILDNNQLDALYALDGVGQGIAGGATKLPTEASTETTDGEKSRPKVTRTTPAADPIGDGQLLKIAKAIGKDWEALAKNLELSDEDIEETKSAAGDSYHGGFKCLFLWRDNCVENGQSTAECVVALKEILTKTGRADLAENIGNS